MPFSYLPYAFILPFLREAQVHDAFLIGFFLVQLADDLAAAHNHEAVAHAEQFGKFGGNHDDGDAFCQQFIHNFINFLLSAWCVYLDPHFIIGTLDFLPCLQASRLRFDDRWMLEAVMARSGIPPAVIVQVTTDASRLKWA